MKKTLTLIATAALMGSTAFAPLAIAQDANPPAAGTTAPASPNATPAMPATPGATTADSGAASGSYLTEQAANQISANDYIGNSVYTSADESIGNVTNLILEENGGIVAAVVGVGGFLGIGAKDVAVPMDKITVTRDTNNGTVRLTTTETAESLKSAPEFMTLKDKNANASTATPAATDTTQTGATKP
ncbi:PRC-barrel domain-containing protein [uncultured Agrobacterium sp.]|uniref:PRC-barrel domain-containing protein n=1 Tax=uncultured Agrobacterium sp. TaxID=157277 RepID=UPI0025F00F6A|nr:PRC-barrel domain-containing protein [uncultured Agrobacterium sp.]